MSDKGMLWALLLILGIVGSVSVVAFVVSGAKPKPPSGAKSQVNVQIKGNRAVGKDPLTGNVDSDKVDVEILYGEKVVYSTTLSGIRGDTYNSFAITLPVGTYTLKIYYPNKTYPVTVTTQNFTVVANLSVTVCVMFDVGEPSRYTSFTVETPLSALDTGESSLIMAIGGDEKKYKGIINGNVISWIVPQSANLIGGRITESGASDPFYFMFTNVRAVKDLRVKLHEELHSNNETQTTVEAVIFKDSKPFSGCRVVVYKGENPIIEKDVYDIGDGEYGIREIVTRGTGGYDIMVKDKLGNTYGSIHIDSLEACKVHVFVFDVVNKWR